MAFCPVTYLWGVDDGSSEQGTENSSVAGGGKVTHFHILPLLILHLLQFSYISNLSCSQPDGEGAAVHVLNGDVVVLGLLA